MQPNNRESPEASQSAKHQEKGGVFIHCAMGKSRSATLVCAYLIWKYHVTAAAALEQLCEGRPICDPNPGFKEQLGVWERMCRAEAENDGEAKRRIYEEWEKNRFTGEVWEWEKRQSGGEKKGFVESKL
jgi:dual specificity phosphatase 12